jgi:hypothetical protein
VDTRLPLSGNVPDYQLSGIFPDNPLLGTLDLLDKRNFTDSHPIHLFIYTEASEESSDGKKYWKKHCLFTIFDYWEQYLISNYQVYP